MVHLKDDMLVACLVDTMEWKKVEWSEIVRAHQKAELKAALMGSY